MSKLINEAIVAFRRWVETRDDGPLPVVRVVLTSHESWYFNGLSAAPTMEHPEVTVVSSSGGHGPTLVIRDEDIYLIEIQPLGTEG